MLSSSKFDIRNLNFKIIQPRQVPPKGELEAYKKSYSLWKRVWAETFHELEGKSTIYSDDFFRQDEAFVVFHHDECVGITMHSFLDLKNPVHRDLRYFKAYPPGSVEDIEQLDVRHVLISNQTAVDPRFRKSLTQISFGEVLIGLSVKRLIELGLDAFIAYTNNSKKVQEICYRFGARPIVKGHSQHNVEVDIVCLKKENACESPIRDIRQTIDFLWNSRFSGQGMKIEIETAI